MTDDFEMACALIENHPRPSNKCKSRVAAGKQAMPLDAFLQHTDFDKAKRHIKSFHQRHGITKNESNCTRIGQTVTSRFSILLLIKLTNKGGRSYKESWKASLRWAEHVVEEVGSSRQAFKQGEWPVAGGYKTE